MTTTLIDGAVILMGVTGKYVNPLDLQPGDIDVNDIAHHLGAQCRYSGATREFYSVGQHTTLCAREVEARGGDWNLVYTTLHHDDGEAYLQDLVRPLKMDPYFGKAYRGAETRAEKVIFGVLDDVTYPFPDEVKEMDNILLATERRDLMPPNGKWKVLEGIAPLPQHIVPWSTRKSRTEFMKMHERLTRRKPNGN